MFASAGQSSLSDPDLAPTSLLAALRETEEAYRRLFELSPLPMCVRDVETMRNYEVNPVALQTYGYTRNEFLALDTRELLDPEERARFESYIASRDPTQTESYAGRWRHRRKDGTPIQVEVWSHSLVFRGRPSRLVVVRDITEQLKAEAEVKMGRERFQLIAAATSDAIWDWDFATNTLWWGDSFYSLFGYKPEDFNDSLSAWADAIHPDDRDRVVRSLEAARDESRDTWREEYRFRRKDGTYATVVDRGRIMRDASGRPHRIVGGMTDITEQSRLQKQYLRTQRLESIGTLAGGIAHDLNNTLAPILLGVELLRIQNPAPAALRYLDTIENSARRSADLVRQVLTFAHGAEGQRVPVQPRHLLKETARFASETFPRNVSIHVDLPAELWTIEADPTQLSQVLLNLALNARDAMPNGGQLKLAAANEELAGSASAGHPGCKPGPHVVFTVSDSGEGIAAENLEHIFEPFFTTRDVGKGTGLGLATVHAIVREHGGFVAVQTSPGRGATFYVHLPASPGLGIAVLKPGDSSTKRGDGQTILIIDDEPALRDLARHSLERFGYQVLTAADGAEGVSLFTRNREQIRLVITDMAMPVMDGAATINALYRIDPRLPIIATSGHDPSGRLTREIQNRIRIFLPKPFGPEQLLNAIHQVLPTHT